MCQQFLDVRGFPKSLGNARASILNYFQSHFYWGALPHLAYVPNSWPLHGPITAHEEPVMGYQWAISGYQSPINHEPSILLIIY